jgi:hypothetical protein
MLVDRCDKRLDLFYILFRFAAAENFGKKTHNGFQIKFSKVSAQGEVLSLSNKMRQCFDSQIDSFGEDFFEGWQR